MERYGYIRVSSKDQNPERQLLAMQEQQIAKEKIYLDKMSGQDFSRPQYVKLLKKLKKAMWSSSKVSTDWAETMERAFIRQRQEEGIAAAKEKGVQFGRRGQDCRMSLRSIWGFGAKEKYRYARRQRPCRWIMQLFTADAGNGRR